MFTVKHIESNGQYECVRQARTVGFHAQGPNHEYATVVAYDVPGTEDGVCQFQTGRIYVMNENGRTVADYDLRALNKNKGITA